LLLAVAEFTYAACRWPPLFFTSEFVFKSSVSLTNIVSGLKRHSIVALMFIADREADSRVYEAEEGFEGHLGKGAEEAL